jgi:chemotaxis signal transduction protein
MNRATQTVPGDSRQPRRTEQVILFTVGEHLFAIAADSIAEIRSTDSLAGAATELTNSTVPKVRHTAQRGRSSYFVVRASLHFRLPLTRPTLVFILRQTRIAVLVDAIERMASISKLSALPQAFCGEEQQWYRGLTLIDDRVVPVVNPLGFLSAQEIAILDEAIAGGAAGALAEQESTIA